VENNLNEITGKLTEFLDGFTKELPKLTEELTAMVKNNPQLAEEYAKVLGDKDFKKKFGDLEKDIKNINHVFRK